MTIVFLGDSLIFGYGVSPQERWITLVKKNEKIKVINKGVNGNLTQEMIYRFDTDVIHNKPDYVFIMGGSNDLVFNVGKSESIMKNLEILIQKAEENNIKVIVGIPPLADGQMARQAWTDGTDYDAMNGELKIIQQKIHDISKKKDIIVVDFLKVFEEVVTEENKEDYLIDGLHPKGIGQELMFKIFKKDFLDK